MSNFLMRLAARSLGMLDVISPRSLSLFEPPPQDGDLIPHEDLLHHDVFFKNNEELTLRNSIFHHSLPQLRASAFSFLSANRHSIGSRHLSSATDPAAQRIDQSDEFTASRKGEIDAFEIKEVRSIGTREEVRPHIKQDEDWIEYRTMHDNISANAPIPETDISPAVAIAFSIS